jgi:hypothetical protein
MSEIDDLIANHPEHRVILTQAWTCGMRDGVTTAARGITEVVKENDLPESIQRLLLTVAQSVTLAAYFVPDAPETPSP